MRAAEAVRTRITAPRGSEPAGPATLPAAIRRLTDRGDLAGGLVAVAMTAADTGHGWAEPWRGLLHRLRQHPHPDVRENALAVDMTPAALR